MRVVGEIRYLGMPVASPAEAALDAALAHPVDGFLVVVALDAPDGETPTFRVEVANEAAGRLLGRPGAEGGWDPLAGFAADWRQEIADAWLAAIETGRTW